MSAQDHLISPHGGTLVDLMADEDRSAQLKIASREWPSWDLIPARSATWNSCSPAASLRLRGSWEKRTIARSASACAWRTARCGRSRSYSTSPRRSRRVSGPALRSRCGIPKASCSPSSTSPTCGSRIGWPRPSRCTEAPTPLIPASGTWPTARTRGSWAERSRDSSSRSTTTTRDFASDRGSSERSSRDWGGGRSSRSKRETRCTARTSS